MEKIGTLTPEEIHSSTVNMEDREEVLMHAYFPTGLVVLKKWGRIAHKIRGHVNPNTREHEIYRVNTLSDPDNMKLYLDNLTVIPFSFNSERFAFTIEIYSVILLFSWVNTLLF